MGFVLEVYKTAFKLIERPLKSVRPLIFQNIDLKESNIDRRDNEKIEAYVISIINKMIEKANILYKHRPARVALPLIRLKIEITGYPQIRSRRLITQFNGRIANLKDFVDCYKRKINHLNHGLTGADLIK